MDIVVAAVQFTSVPGEIAGNHVRISSLIRKCASNGAQLVLLPELFASGYRITKESVRFAEPLDVSLNVVFFPPSILFCILI